ncbi:hypothetical protein N657DRAFT_263283 [Parathielavia appendiculata]|uniref:Uncharacterized protein n=1 Tax=Parathielavia appendiculata TaxID=2587402 RepID=A0AAN6TR98_9PEZI|nr:hypothetical protein N657DRAFT_263283 [Parathielavia appendiculata]
MISILLESGAFDIRSEIGETSLMVAVRRRGEDIFWLLIEFGCCPATPPLRCPPESIDHLLAQMMSPPALIRYPEIFLFQSFDPRLSQPRTAGLCARCLASFPGAKPAVQEAWRAERPSRIGKWIPVEDAFSHGFLRRCRICREPIVELPPPFDASHGSEKRAITYSALRVPQLADFLPLQNLRSSLPGLENAGPRCALCCRLTGFSGASSVTRNAPKTWSGRCSQLG